MHIYQLKNKVTGKPYVGQSLDYMKRFKKHINNANKGINRRLYDSMRFHSADSFEPILLEETTLDQADSREKYWITTLNTIMPHGYNMTEGGGGGNTLSKWSDEAKKELYRTQALNRSWYKHRDNPEAIKRMSIAAKEIASARTIEEREIISEKMSISHKALAKAP